MIILDIKRHRVNLYPIGRAKGALNSHRKPLFNGTFRLTEEKNTPKAIDFNIIKSSIAARREIKELFDILNRQNIYLTGRNEMLEEFLSTNNIEYSIVDVCSRCLHRNIITIINDKHSHKISNTIVCDDCMDESIAEYLSANNYSDATFKRFRKLYEKTKNANLIFDMIENEYDPVENDELTLYDVYEVRQENFAQVNVDTLEIPSAFRDILKKRINYLLPVQILALNEGLLYKENLLVVSATASGKTLIGELAGITDTLKRKKFIYLSPIVALANQKYRDFRQQYEMLGLKVAIKVGQNRVRAADELVIEDMPVSNADIVVATYEGLDYILRSGSWKSLDNLGVVVIDEIHMLEDEERGSRLNGLINRLMTIYPQAQLIGLSATIKNPEELAEAFGMTLVEYDNRPVRLERHLIYCENQNQKRKIIERLCRKEYRNISSRGYRGQTIIFTDSRRKTQMIADYLIKNGVEAKSYHAGLTYQNKVDIEEEFARQEISAVVTTAALAAGVDFPSSQVIFESLRMGKEWINHNEFFQMIGRAGRPTYHDTGKIYVLATTNTEYNHELEEIVATDLLESDVDDVQVSYNRNQVLEQILSDISSNENVTIERLRQRYNSLYIPIRFDEAVRSLHESGMIEYNPKKDNYAVTRYGRAVSMSFITTDEAEYILENIGEDPTEIIITLNPISNVYLSNRMVKSFKRILNFNVSTRLFADSTRDLITDGTFLNKLSDKHESQLINLYTDYISCDCHESPYCDCMERNVSRHILERRLQGWTPGEIGREFMKKYSVNIYSGDIYNWLDQVIRYSESIERIAKSLDITSVAAKSKEYTYKIEYGEKK